MVAREMETRTITRRRVLRVLVLIAMGDVLSTRRAHQHPLQDLELLQALAGAEDHRLERRLGDVDRHPGLVTEPLVEATKERSPTGQNDALVHDVGGELRG